MWVSHPLEVHVLYATMMAELYRSASQNQQRTRVSFNWRQTTREQDSLTGFVLLWPWRGNWKRGSGNRGTRSRGGKHGRNEHGKPKFRFSNIVVESSIGLVCPSGLQQPIELNVIQNDVTHLYILRGSYIWNKTISSETNLKQICFISVLFQM